MTAFRDLVSEITEDDVAWVVELMSQLRSCKRSGNGFSIQGIVMSTMDMAR